MGGFGKAVESAMEVVPHKVNCVNKEKADHVQHELDNYQEIMYNGFENTTNNDERIKFVNLACQAKFWTTNMVTDITYGKCKGCDQVISQYLMVPLYVLCGVDERDNSKETSEILKPLNDISQSYNEQMETLMEIMENQEPEYDSSSDE